MVMGRYRWMVVERVRVRADQVGSRSDRDDG